VQLQDPDPDKHFALAFVFRCHADDFHLLSSLMNGDGAREPTAP
jgi:hypothetical protein